MGCGLGATTAYGVHQMPVGGPVGVRLVVVRPAGCRERVTVGRQNTHARTRMHVRTHTLRAQPYSPHIISMKPATTLQKPMTKGLGFRPSNNKRCLVSKCLVLLACGWILFPRPTKKPLGEKSWQRLVENHKRVGGEGRWAHPSSVRRRSRRSGSPPSRRRAPNSTNSPSISWPDHRAPLGDGGGDARRLGWGEPFRCQNRG